MTLRYLVPLLAVIAVPAMAQQSPAPAASGASSAASADANKQFCRREQALGSIMPGKKVCHTKAEWNAIDLANNEAASNALSRRNSRLNGRN